MKLTSFSSHDGTSVACHVTGRGSPLVLVHGATADHNRWTPVLSTLEQRYTVHALDRRGRGASGDNPTYAFEREVEDIAAVVDGIGGPVDLVAHSYGALLSLEASLHAANIRKLVLYEPPVPTKLAPVLTQLLDRVDALVAAGDRDAAVTLFLSEGARVPPHELTLMKSLPAWSARVAAAHTIARELRAVDAYHMDSARFATMRTPTLLMLGGASPPYFRAAIELVQAALPHAQLCVLPNQQHVAMDTAPDLFLRELLQFLAG